MSRKSTTKAAPAGGKSDVQNATTTTVDPADVAAAAASMSDVVDVGERSTEVPPEASSTAPREDEVRPEDVPPTPGPEVQPPAPEAEPDVQPPAPEEGVPPAAAEPGAPAVDAEPELPVEEAVVSAPVSDETFFRCNGCGKPGPAAANEAESLEKALADGWFMSQHPTPLPYCCGGSPDAFPFDRAPGT